MGGNVTPVDLVVDGTMVCSYLADEEVTTDEDTIGVTKGVVAGVARPLLPPLFSP